MRLMIPAVQNPKGRIKTRIAWKTGMLPLILPIRLQVRLILPQQKDLQYLLSRQKLPISPLPILQVRT